MARFTLQAWWCGPCGTRNTDHVKCSRCGHPRIERHAQVHASEKAVVYLNPTTGEHRTPPRADMPMPLVYESQGFVRHEIESMTKWERSSGVVHEASNFHPGNEPTPDGSVPRKKAPKELIESLAREISSAAASGWTTEPGAKSIDIPIGLG